MPCIQTIVTDLFEMLFRDMPDQAGNEFHYWDGFHNELVVFMPVVMKSNIFTIVFINAGSGNDGSARISADVFGNNLRIAFVGLGINIKAIFVVVITFSFDFFEGGTQLMFHKIQKGSTESITEKSVIKMCLGTPTPTVTDAAL